MATPLAQYQQLLQGLKQDERNRYIYAELNDLFVDISASMFSSIVKEPPFEGLSSFAKNYLAAMVELAASQKKVAAPLWVKNVTPLDTPYFGSELASLRLYLLTQSPAVFRSRNIYIDSSIGDRV